jgi:hypothetical protein
VSTVSIDANLLTRCIAALRQGRLLEERSAYVEQVLFKYQHALESTVSQCAQRWDFTDEAWEAPGQEASHRPTLPPGGKARGSEAASDVSGKVVVIGGVRYVTVPGMDALRTLHKPHDLLHDPRLSGASCSSLCFVTANKAGFAAFCLVPSRQLSTATSAPPPGDASLLPAVRVYA